MAITKRKRTPPPLPEHLIFNEIFPRLPAKSIHRFRCVSTSCGRLFTSDQQFLAAARRLSRRRYFLSLSRPYQGLSLYSLNQSGVATEIPKNPTDRCIHASIINGLVFTVVNTDQGGYKYTVSNADTEETFELPQITARPKSPADDHKNRLFFYLCHDPKTDMYKVLRTVSAHKDPEAMRFSVITLGAKSWNLQNIIQDLRQLGAVSFSVNNH